MATLGWLLLSCLPTFAASTETNFLAMCGAGDAEQVATLLRTRPGLTHAKDSTAATGLHYAARSGQFEIAKLLVTQGANIEARDVQKRTPLHEAAAHGQAAIVRLLLSNRANIEALDATGATPLLLASIAEQQARAATENPFAPEIANTHETVEALTTGGAKTDVFFYLAMNNTNAVARLIDRDRNALTAHNRGGLTPLAAAVTANNADLVTLLLALGADPNNRDATGHNLLSVAATTGAATIAELLLAKGAAVDARDALGNTALHSAVAASQKTMIALLLAHKANTTQRNKSNQVAADLAQGEEAAAIRNLILAPEFSPLVAYRSPELHEWAATNAVAEMTSLLHADRTAINARDCFGRTALHLAIANDHRDAFNLLLNHGADVNMVGATRATPLHIAAQRGQRDMAILLLIAGAKVNARDQNNLTPLALALKFRHPEIEAVLRKAGAAQ